MITCKSYDVQVNCFRVFEIRMSLFSRISKFLFQNIWSGIKFYQKQIIFKWSQQLALSLDIKNLCLKVII